MNFSATRVLLGLSFLSLGLSGCQGLGSALGLGKNPPDEFAITTKAPLTLPPDFALRPPQPGETRPERLSQSDRTRQLLLGDETNQPPTNGELALLQSVGALDVDPSIRAILAAENGGRASKDESFANQILFWQVNDDGSIDDSDAPLRVEDREAWLADRADAVENVTGGDAVTISNRERRILSLPGVQ